MAYKYIRFAASADAPSLPGGQAVMEAVAVGADGAPVDIGGGSYTLPAATTTALGGVKKAPATAAVASADAQAAAGDAPTKAEFDALATLANECKAQLNDFLAKAKSAGIMA